jgi:hypothetical protein
MGVVEIQEQKSALAIAGKGKRQLSFLAGAAVLIALVVPGVSVLTHTEGNKNTWRSTSTIRPYKDMD